MNRITGLSFIDKPDYTEMISTRYLSDILGESKIEKIDFFSLDVEGAEYDVLSTMNWDIPIHVILAEIKADNIYSGEKNKKCKDLLEEKGFIYHSSTKTDEVWINPNY